MTDKEALLVALEALHYCEALNRDVDERKMQAITVIRKLWTEHAMKETQRLGQEIEQEPAALMQEADVRMMADVHGINPSTRGLYGFYIDCVSTSPQPPQRTWVDLPHEDILDLFDEHNVYGSKWLEFARAVLAKSKEKNT